MILLIAAQAIIFCEIFVQLPEFSSIFADSTLDDTPVLIFFLYTLDTSPFSSSILSVFSASGTALVVIVLGVKLARRGGRFKWLKPFLATSQMSLTLYVVHIAAIQLFIVISSRQEAETSLEEAWILAQLLP